MKTVKSVRKESMKEVSNLDKENSVRSRPNETSQIRVIHTDTEKKMEGVKATKKIKEIYTCTKKK
jgi:hypothetical protein